MASVGPCHGPNLPLITRPSFESDERTGRGSPEPRGLKTRQRFGPASLDVDSTFFKYARSLRKRVADCKHGFESRSVYNPYSGFGPIGLRWAPARQRPGGMKTGLTFPSRPDATVAPMRVPLRDNPRLPGQDRLERPCFRTLWPRPDSASACIPACIHRYIQPVQTRQEG